MEIILKERPNKQATFSYVSDEIYKRKLYLKKDGGKAQASQIRLRAKNYSQFEVLPPRELKLV